MDKTREKMVLMRLTWPLLLAVASWVAAFYHATMVADSLKRTLTLLGFDYTCFFVFVMTAMTGLIIGIVAPMVGLLVVKRHDFKES
ncbi:LOW QUALITY PROTEIN: hypothetical protein PanWU01x14_152060 [Parasponia andersonii]|uniref:Transmembrane protein n=1 Tax=Parasponia andersonii TaxID=3476 RepID=A0A2P5CHT8_PARAD|nr:LOW QUALITY PROTEIN: hypothetical protein PanWU01x14_152060 [Parasponia andersonii]